MKSRRTSPGASLLGASLQQRLLPGMGLKGASPFPAEEGERRPGSLLLTPLPVSPAEPWGHAASSCGRYLLCLWDGTCKVSPMGNHLSLYKVLMAGSCRASLSLSVPGALVGGCWCHPKQGTRKPRVQPLPPKHTGTTLGFENTIYYNGAFQAKIPSQGPGVGFRCGRL